MLSVLLTPCWQILGWMPKIASNLPEVRLLPLASCDFYKSGKRLYSKRQFIFLPNKHKSTIHIQNLKTTTEKAARSHYNNAQSKRTLPR